MCGVDGKQTRCGVGGRRGEAVSFDALHVGTRPRGAERGKPGVRRSKGQAHPTSVGVPRQKLFTPEWGPGGAESWGG